MAVRTVQVARAAVRYARSAVAAVLAPLALAGALLLASAGVVRAIL
ncbi:MAG: hypothetical protein LM577_00580 [Thermoproteaceae archaeon]|nr:hypothetical protein [Thermoproteaceae archaeon]